MAHVLYYAMTHSEADWDDVTDALAELLPKKREFWLRVQATSNIHLLEAMTALFEEDS